MKILKYFNHKDRFLSKSNWAPILEPFKRVFVNVKDNFKHKGKLLKEGKEQVDKVLSELENFNFNSNKDIEIKISRKIKNINIFKLKYFKGSVKKLFAKVGIHDFKKFFKINKTNRIVGFSPDYVGLIPSRPVNFNNIYIKFFKNNFMRIKIEFPMLHENLVKSLAGFREVFSGSYDSNSGHLQNFLSDNLDNGIKANEILGKVKDCRWIKVPHLIYSDFSSSINWMNYNPKSSPGHYTSKLFNTNFKGNTVVYSFELAKRKFDLISRIPIRNYCLWDVFAREKDINVSDFKAKKNLSTRVVLNTEHYETILLSYFFQPLMKAVDSFGSNIKFHISGEYDGSKANSLHKRLVNYDFYVDADWSFFDASIDTEYLKAVGAIMFSRSIKDKNDLRKIFHVISSFITKYIVLPPGIVIELNRGNPSGHPGVTAINCYTNIIRWSLIGREIYGPNYQEYMDIEVYGDDAVVMFKYHENLFNIDDIIIKLGYKSDKLVDKLYDTKKFGIYENKGPDFLKRRILRGQLSWNTNKMFDKLVYQSKRRNIVDQINLIINYYMTAPGNDGMFELCHLFLNYCEKEFNKDYKIVDHIVACRNLIINFNDKKFYQSTKFEKLYDAEFKVMNSSIQMVKTRMMSETRKRRINNEELDMMRLLFMINEYVYHPFRLTNIKNLSFKADLFKILMNFKNTLRIYYKKGKIDTS